MEKFLLILRLMTEREFRILKDLFYFEPDCAKFIARRLRLDLKEVMEGLKFLENLGILVRVSQTFVKKGGKIKHRNHSYYEINSEWRKFLKKSLFKKERV